jgi:hypothetical protein
MPGEHEGAWHVGNGVQPAPIRAAPAMPFRLGSSTDLAAPLSRPRSIASLLRPVHGLVGVMGVNTTDKACVAPVLNTVPGGGL